MNLSHTALVHSTPMLLCVQMGHIQRLLIYKEKAHPALCPRFHLERMRRWWGRGRTCWRADLKILKLFHARSGKAALSPFKQMEDITGVILLMLINSRQQREKSIGSRMHLQTDQKKYRFWWRDVIWTFLFSFGFSNLEPIRYKKIYIISLKIFISIGISVKSKVLIGMSQPCM